MVEKFFVYGSLSEGMVHHEHIRNYIKDSEPAQVQGSVYQLQVGYPVFSEQGGSLISGQALSIETSDTFWALMDELHGVHPSQPQRGLHFRRQIRAQVNGRDQLAQIYVVNLAKLPRTAEKLLDGDWLARMREKPPLALGLSEAQVNYLKELGQSSGRDIVPVKLELYRELMNLGLIVDKGRRLALSRLGKELYRYL